jgi:23S rRNA pseudouridine1911/1915/1917 synthase
LPSGRITGYSYCVLCIRYEDPSLVVVDKPAGMHTAPLSPGERGTLLALVQEAFPEVAALPGLKPLEPGLVHRLDRDTSGLVVIARTAAAFERLRSSFAAGGARKWYLAACAFGDTSPLTERLRVESRFAPYGRGRKMVRPVLAGERSRKLLASAGSEQYLTEAVVVGRGAGRALLSVTILKGFRHQVRAHLACLGFPILGDPLYGAALPEGVPKRMYLHAERIELPHPDTGRTLTVESEAPPEFRALFE